MRTETIEIYSDTTNHAIMRHPDRKYPGMLIQGDSLWQILQHINRALEFSQPNAEASDALEGLQEEIEARLLHYKKT